MKLNIANVYNDENGSRLLGALSPRSDLGVEMVTTDEGVIIDVVNMEGEVIGSWHETWTGLLDNYLSWDGTEGELF